MRCIDPAHQPGKSDPLAEPVTLASREGCGHHWRDLPRHQREFRPPIYQQRPERDLPFSILRRTPKRVSEHRDPRPRDDTDVVKDIARELADIAHQIATFNAEANGEG